MKDNVTLGKDITESIRREAGTALAGAAGGSSRYTYVCTAADSGLSVKLILKKRMGFSSRLVTRMKQGGTVMRNGVAVLMFAEVIEGDVIDVTLPEEKNHFIPEDIPVDVVYEDEDMLVINKQPWLVVHPTAGHQTGTLANALMFRMEQLDQSFKIRFVNRLDRDTSGLMIVAKNSHCQDMLTKQMKSDSVDKRYLAIVHGIIKEDEGTIDLPIDRRNPENIHREVMEGGYPSVTHYRVLERFGKDAAGPYQVADNAFDDSTYKGEIPDGFTFVELRLETGRTHQIRVHMSHVGHPLAGDPLYCREEPELIARQALHAARLSFNLPLSEERISFEAELPDDMKKLLERLRG